MILIKEAGKIKIEKHTQCDSNLSFILIYNRDKKVSYTSSEITPGNFFYTVSIPDLTNGEYYYQILSNDIIIESGLLYFGEINKESEVYHAQKEVYTYGR